MMTSNCHTCGFPKEPANYADPYCPACTTLKREGEQHHAAENPNATESEILYAGRCALRQRAHHAHRNFVDPRGFGATRGMIPIPPQSRAQDAPPR